MSVARWFLSLVVLFTIGVASSVYAAERGGAPVNRHAQLLQGNWLGAQGKITFSAKNTAIYKGKRYYCAIASGTIQLSRHGSTRMIPYRISDGKLILTVDGQDEIYSRSSPRL